MKGVTSGVEEKRGGHCLAEDQVIALMAGELDPIAFAEVEQHLDGCRLCRLLVSTLAAHTVDGPARGTISAFAPGDLVADRYRLIALLGVGGMGEVYEALDMVLGETIALKTIAVGATLGDRGVERLKAEVQFARSVTHRNVCRVFDVGFHTDGAITFPFFTMELLAGETLRTHLRRGGPMPLAQVSTIIEQMACGLDSAHAAGVIHRDLKSENVMLVPAVDGTRVVIMDFGLARQLPGWAPGRLTGANKRPSGRVVGTFGYMAPEQLAGEPTGPATDVYALGVIAFEMITGAIPFGLPDMVTAGANARPESPHRPLEWPDGVPGNWQAAIQRCLEIAPAQRFQRAGDLVAALLEVAPPPPKPRRHLWRLVVAAAAVTAGATLSASILLPLHLARKERAQVPTFPAVVRMTAPESSRPPARSASVAVEAADPPEPAPVPGRRAGDNRGTPSRQRILVAPAPEPGVPPPRPRASLPPAALTQPAVLTQPAAAIVEPRPASEEPGADDLIDPFGTR